MPFVASCSWLRIHHRLTFASIHPFLFLLVFLLLLYLFFDHLTDR